MLPAIDDGFVLCDLERVPKQFIGYKRLHEGTDSDNEACKGKNGVTPKKQRATV
jgi:hypothetical protein